MRINHKQKFVRCNFFADEFNLPDYRDSPEFLDYAARIEDIIKAASEPITICDIHKALGADMKREWTMDALESLTPTIRLISGIRDRYEFIRLVRVKSVNGFNTILFERQDSDPMPSW